MSVGPSVYDPLPKEGPASACLHLCGEDGRALSCYLLNFHVPAAAQQNILTLKLCAEADQVFVLPETLNSPLFLSLLFLCPPLLSLLPPPPPPLLCLSLFFFFFEQLPILLRRRSRPVCWVKPPLRE